MQPSLPGSRRAAIDDIATALARAAGGACPRTLVITAGPGAGKTHTLRHLVRTTDLPVRWATADELSWRQPYAVAAALLDIAIPAPVPAGFAAALDVAADLLCSREPHLLVVDDVHNADAGSLEFLGALAAAAPDLPLVVLLARRHLPARELLSRLITRPSVAEWHLPPMDSTDLEVLAHQVVGAWPDERLGALLARSGGNPLHARALLDDLRAHGGLVTDGATAGLAATAPAAPPASLHAAIRQQLALLDDRSRALARQLAVWGGPAALDDLAALDNAPPSALVGSAQTAVDAGVIAVSAGGTLAFTHTVYAEVAYEGLEPALRAVLHRAIARHHEAAGDRQMVAHHLLAAGTDDEAATTALDRAQQELANVPAVAADLLGTAALRAPAAAPIRSLELDLATALARSGQLARSAEVAAQGLAQAGDIGTVARLHRILLFTLTAQGRTAQVLELTSATMRLPIDPPTRAALLDIRRYVGILGGIAPLPREPYVFAAPGTVNELVTEALRRFLTGDGAGGLELALEASRRAGAADAAPEPSSSADVWPPYIEQYVHGPAAAEALLDRAVLLRTGRDAAWMTVYHDFTRGGIALALGRLDDAAAVLDAGLERAAAADMGWTSLAEGARAMIDVHRGQFSAAATRLDRFAASGTPDQFGVPVPGQARLLLLEAQRKLRPAAAVARRCWDHTTGLGLHGWLPVLAVDCARVAHRTGDRALAAGIAAALDEIPEPIPGAGRGRVELARALCDGAPERIGPAAERCARAAREMGDVLTEVPAWEEAACAAAARGDRGAAREHARRALVLTQGMAATALSARITSRLRALGLRLDPRAVRDRPRTGWDSLTPTETTIAELVAAGRNSAEIAAQLHISQRTVQAHVSHALTKLGLRTRVELAALAASRRNTPA